ncbi:pyridoxamine 5'-phosphate oxidase family protein [Microbacterium sp. SS28]|uniref:pyridoxamine 5'-phosphate oxidase family protein n=1 Tax=Microbacterium sp. SS28 TaxID=2919948 RepID=UPI001FA9EC3D|nr:pyridoxamine 5'-phosphate oxidase family protein [Microbacterium sp. SS28]
MDENETPLKVLSDEECWTRITSDDLGRLVTHVGDVLDIFPVNYVVDRGTIVFRTGEGSKLFELTVNDEVLFEVDEHTDADAWSVVVRGHAHRLDTSEEVAEADQLELRPWLPTLKYNYVRIEPTSLSGRAFRRGAEPERYGIADY